MLLVSNLCRKGKRCRKEQFFPAVRKITLPKEIGTCCHSDCLKTWENVQIQISDAWSESGRKRHLPLMSYPVQVSSQIIYIPVSEVELTESFKDVFNHLCYELPPSRPAWWIPDSERAVLWPHPLTQSSDLDVVKWGWDQWLFFVNCFIENTYPCIISGVSEVTVVTPLTTQFHSKLYKT